MDETTTGVSDSVKQTVSEIVPKHIKTFSCKGQLTGLLLGNVQSGKTGQVFGIISASADEGFDLFVLLTTNNVHLQQQTFQRALTYLDDSFCICDESDEIRFAQNKMRRPVLIVLKKDTNVLQKWRNNLSSYGFCTGRPIFIVDDEGDAASLNTKVNKKEQSTINNHLESMQKLGSSSIFLQVTATPQSLLLQTKLSGWKPSFVHYFPPGKNYIGGNFIYSDPMSFVIRLTKENELDDLRIEEGYITEGLKDSLFAFLIAGSHIMITGQNDVCNFLIHPSVSIKDHEIIGEKIGQFLNEMLFDISEGEMAPELENAWKDLQKTKPNLTRFKDINSFIQKCLENEDIRTIIMNSKNSESTDCSKGLNIIVGGNSLGRGVTFPGLQTVYYCRKSKSPQADTFWQHCRMFGYDRDPGLMRVFLPPFLLKLFTELNNANTILIDQVKNKHLDDIHLLYARGIRPTRPNVVEKDALNMIVGGVNFFPSSPEIKNVSSLDNLLKEYGDAEYYEVEIDLLKESASKCSSSTALDWPVKTYIDCLEALKGDENIDKGILIVRRDRDITKGTGTLLSPNDRALGNKFGNYPVLTLYRLNGKVEQGWEGKPLWVPNIKFPLGRCFYKTD